MFYTAILSQSSEGDLFITINGSNESFRLPAGEVAEGYFREDVAMARELDWVEDDIVPVTDAPAVAILVHHDGLKRKDRIYVLTSELPNEVNLYLGMRR